MAQDQSDQLTEVIRERRKTLRMTQEELSTLAGCNPLVVYKLEKGDTRVRLQSFLAIVTALGLKVEIADS